MAGKGRNGSSNNIHEHSVHSFSQPAGLTNFTKDSGNLKPCINSFVAIKTLFSPFTPSFFVSDGALVCSREWLWWRYCVGLWFSRSWGGRGGAEEIKQPQRMTTRPSAMCLPAHSSFYLPAREGASSCKVSVGFRTSSHSQISLFNKWRLKAVVPFGVFLQPSLVGNTSFGKWPLKAEIDTTQKGRRISPNRNIGRKGGKTVPSAQRRTKLQCCLSHVHPKAM